ncbi:beta-microseminoprotein isoform X2 [Cricetulus griseus]|uniref:Beta-microseminoprotein n=1 Tax=Cricetulus griseus TaxID=10029 RepID=A0A9J7KFK6_CRIGR|nr:beta-microseminoprotein isoform X2 [Cricetulus griseus]
MRLLDYKKALLGSLLFLATLVTTCNAVCSLELREGHPNQPPGDCVDSDGDKHPINSYWVKDCKRCFCGEDTISCCTQTAIPSRYDKEKCQQNFHPENCTYTVVEKKNPGKPCLVEDWVL